MLLAWFAYLQAAPGLVIAHLRDELGLSYSAGGLHVAAFAAGSMVAGVVAARLERALGRRALLWSAAALLGAGAVGLTAGRVVEAHRRLGAGHGRRRRAAARHDPGRARRPPPRAPHRGAGRGQRGGRRRLRGAHRRAVAHRGAARRLADRPAGLARRPAARLGEQPAAGVRAPPPAGAARGRLGGVFWIAAAMLFCTTAAEWCVTAWGATFVHDAAARLHRRRRLAHGRLLRGRGGRARPRQPAGAPPRPVPAARRCPRRVRGGVRDPVARDDARAGAARPVAARGRAGQPVPDGHRRDRRPRPGPRGARERTRGGDDVVRGAARAPCGRGAGGRDLADGGARGRPGRPRARRRVPRGGGVAALSPVNDRVAGDDRLGRCSASNPP